ncbi:hypothetical protein GW17_00039095 [Ensete ventricosum]|nr:hypothetical protein GW17_00039095 [Ensete ventricosum]
MTSYRYRRGHCCPITGKVRARVVIGSKGCGQTRKQFGLSRDPCKRGAQTKNQTPRITSRQLFRALKSKSTDTQTHHLPVPPPLSCSLSISLERYRERICFSLKRWSMESCDAALPYTLIGLLLRQTATNALLWVCLISVTSLLCGRLARLVQERRESLAEYMNERIAVRANVIPSEIVECVVGRVDNIMAKGILDCISVSRQLAFYILGSTLFGDAFFYWPKASIYEKLLITIAKDGCFWASYTIPPFWSREFWKYKHMCKRLKHLTQDIIQHCVERYDLLSKIGHSSCKDNKGIEDVARFSDSVLLDNMPSGVLFQEEMAEYLKEELCGNILGLMFHGYLATSSLITLVARGRLFSLRGERDRGDVVEPVGRSRALAARGRLFSTCGERDRGDMDSYIWGKDAGRFNPLRFLPEATDHIGSAAIA